MIIPIHISFRGVVFASLAVFAIGFWIISNNSKDKEEYLKSHGRIEYLELEYQHLPARHKGDYRYLKVEGYPYIFEIYEPNGEPTIKSIDHLKVGDVIDIYYYETSDTRNSGLNRFTQFIDYLGQPYFIRNDFQKELGFSLMGLCLLIGVIAFFLAKKEKLPW